MTLTLEKPVEADVDARLKAHDEAIALCAYKDDSECTPDERNTRFFEYCLCRDSYRRFRRWCRLADAPPPGQNVGGGTIPFETWGHTQAIINALLTQRHIVILKSRQIGVSWEVAAYCLWQALFKDAFKALLFSKGQTEASELLDKAKFVYNNLPAYMRLKLGADSKTEMYFPDMNSKIMALPATQSAGVSFTASVIVYDEWEQHEYAEQNYANAKPVIDAGGQVVGVFTRDPYRVETLARKIFVEGQARRNDYVAMFFGWKVRPNRNEAWYEATKKSIPQMDLGTLTPDLYMRCNYPGTVEEALAPLQIVSACDQMVLEAMKEDCRAPLQVPEAEVDSHFCNIYKPYSTGAFYIAATDTSHGVQQDYSSTIVLNVKTGEIVADILDNTLSPEKLAAQSVRLLSYYHSPLWYIEDNDWGASTIKVAQQLEYRNLGKWADRTGKQNLFRVGWHTNESNRDLLWGALIPAINNRQIVIYNARGLAQFVDLKRNPDKHGRIEAQKGRNDDYPMALAIAYYNRDRVQTSVDAYKPIQTLHFSGGRRTFGGFARSYR